MKRVKRFLAALSVLLAVPLLMGAATGRSYVTGMHMLVLDGVKTGFVHSFEGGMPYADVVAEPAQSSGYVKKHVGTPKYEDITLQVGVGLTKEVYQWITDTWRLNAPPKSGSIIAVNTSLNAQSELQFSNALLLAVTVPALGAVTKDAAYLTLKIAPEYTKRVSATGKVQGDLGKNSHERWLSHNFRVSIDGLDASKVSLVESFTVKQTPVYADASLGRDSALAGVRLEFPDLFVTMAESGAQGWYDWHDQFVVQGNNSESQEKTLTLEALSTDRQKVLFTVKALGVGIYRLETIEDAQEGTSNVRASLYTERMEFSIPLAVAEGADPGTVGDSVGLPETGKTVGGSLVPSLIRGGKSIDAYEMTVRVQSDGQVLLKWTAAQAPAGKSVAGYHVYQAAAGDALVREENRLDEFPVEETTFSDWPGSGTWDYAVQVVFDDDTVGPDSNSVRVTVR